MLGNLVVNLSLVLGTAAAGAAAVLWISARHRGRRRDSVVIHTVAQRVRSVGKLVGLEVTAKEIATASAGWTWLPPLVLSQARLAMIFEFQRQYAVDLTRLEDANVGALPDGRYRLTLPPIQGDLHLIEITPYDIQDGRVLGLLDVIPMKAQRQHDLMKRAQADAAGLFERSDARYADHARRIIAQQLRAFLSLFGVQAEVVWQGAPKPKHQPDSVEPAALPEPAAA